MSTLTRTDPMKTSIDRSIAMNLLNEALSRARMRRPQNSNSEAPRSARRVAFEALRQQSRELGNQSPYGIR
jgi:hypothetical protein